MRKILAFIVSFLFIPACLFAKINVGIVEKVVGSDIYVKYHKIEVPFATGEKLYIDLNGQQVCVFATFPMLSMAKCQVVEQQHNQLSEIKKGMIVYRTEPDYFKDSSSENILGFRDIPFGVDLSKRKGFLPARDEPLNFYERKSDELIFEGMKIDKISYDNSGFGGSDVGVCGVILSVVTDSKEDGNGFHDYFVTLLNSKYHPTNPEYSEMNSPECDSKTISNLYVCGQGYAVVAFTIKAYKSEGVVLRKTYSNVIQFRHMP